MNKSARLLLFIPVIFLIVYHLFKLYNIHYGNDFMGTDEFTESFKEGFSLAPLMIIQSISRILIIVSLAFVLAKKKIGIPGIWIGVCTLIIIQFTLVSASNSQLIHDSLSSLKPLKGLILPLIITYLFKRSVVPSHQYT